MSNNIQNIRNFFNGSFYQNVPVDENVYDMVYGYFLDLTNSKDASDALAQTLFTVSYNTNINPLDVIQEFKKNPNSSELKKLMIAMFNTNKSSTSKLGYSTGTTINRWVARNIVT